MIVTRNYILTLLHMYFLNCPAIFRAEYTYSNSNCLRERTLFSVIKCGQVWSYPVLFFNFLSLFASYLPFVRQRNWFQFWLWQKLSRVIANSDWSLQVQTKRLQHIFSYFLKTLRLIHDSFVLKSFSPNTSSCWKTLTTIHQDFGSTNNL